MKDKQFKRERKELAAYLKKADEYHAEIPLVQRPMTSIIRTNTGVITLSALLIFTGCLLDSSGSHIAQALHHIAFVLGGVVIGFGTRRK